jgi:hypothetical protein
VKVVATDAKGRLLKIASNQVNLRVTGARGPIGLDIDGTPAPGDFLVWNGGRRVQGIAGASGPLGSVALTDLAADDGGGLVGFKQAGTGAVSRTMRSKERDFVNLFDFGAVGDGTHDDTDAIDAAYAALPPGARIWGGRGGNTFRYSKTWPWTKPFALEGGAMEENKILFSASGVYQDIGDGSLAAIIAMHTLTSLPGSSVSGDARRSSVRGWTFELEDDGPADLRAMVISTPIYLHECRALNFTGGDFAVMAAQNASSPIQGIANGTTFSRCFSQNSGGHAFHFLGDDANACLVERCFVDLSTRSGFYDDSLIGQTYIACEVQRNGEAGYYTNPAKPIASSYLGCYSETAPHFDIGPLCQCWGAQGVFKPNRAAGGVMMRGLPMGAAYSTQAIRIAETDDIAQSLGAEPSPGQAIHWGETGIDWRSHVGEGLFRLASDYSDDYVTLVVNDTIVMQFPMRATTGNLTLGRGWLENGLLIGGSGKAGFVGAGGAAPTTGTFAKGAIWLHDAPAAGGNWGWVCVTGGTPGTWKELGPIAS